MKKTIEEYIKNYNSQKIKYFFITFVGLSLICVGIPYLSILAMKDSYSHLESAAWLENLQNVLTNTEIGFFLLISTSYILKERKKIASLILFDFSQWLLLVVLFSGMYFAIIVFIDDLFTKILLILPYLLAILKVMFDITKKKSRQQQADKVMETVEKIGSIFFLLIIVIRWISSFIFPNSENISLIGILSPLMIVVGLVFYTEYQWERMIFLNDVLKDQEKVRKETDITIIDWYGSKSKEYKATKNKSIN